MDQNTAVIVDNFTGAAGKTSGRLRAVVLDPLYRRPADTGGACHEMNGATTLVSE